MLTVTFYRDDRGRLCGFAGQGHADFAEYGQDIVCAAVSAVLQAARLGLELHCDRRPDVHMTPGELQLRFSEAEREDPAVRAIVTTAEASIAQIARRFPKNVRLKEAADAPKRRGSASGRVTSLADRRRRHDV